MKSILSISVALIFMYIQLFNGLVWISYEINKTEIIKEFCVNKDKPELKCEGSCHMKKMMLEDEKEDEGEAPTVIPQIQLYLLPTLLELKPTISKFHYSADLADLYSFVFLKDWVIPPKY